MSFAQVVPEADPRTAAQSRPSWEIAAGSSAGPAPPTRSIWTPSTSVFPVAVAPVTLTVTPPQSANRGHALLPDVRGADAAHDSYEFLPASGGSHVARSVIMAPVTGPQSQPSRANGKTKRRRRTGSTISEPVGEISGRTRPALMPPPAPRMSLPGPSFICRPPFQGQSPSTIPHHLSFLNMSSGRAASLRVACGGPRDGFADTDSDASSGMMSASDSSVETFLINGAEITESELPHHVGDLVWASVNSFPYWPAIICQEYSSSSYYQVRKCGLKSQLLFHVMYLCDENRQNWVFKSKIQPFHGGALFEDWKKAQLAAAKGAKTRWRLKHLFTVGPKLKAPFVEAVKTGEGLLYKSRQERCDQLLVYNSLDDAVIAAATSSPTEEADTEDEDIGESGHDSMDPGPGPSRLPAPPAEASQQVALSKPSTSVSNSVEIRPIVPKFEKRTERLCSICEDWILEEVGERKGKGKAKACGPVPFGRTGVTCSSGCGKSYHRVCLLGHPKGGRRSRSGRNRKPKGGQLVAEPSEAQLRALDAYVCGECKTGVAECFICEQADPLKTTAKGNRSKVTEEKADQPKVTEKCAHKNCMKRYHMQCVSRSEWRQATLNDGKILCPLHKCHTCTLLHADDPKAVEKPQKLLQCIRCPTAYHYGIECSPAGTHYLGGNFMICPKQHGASKKSLHLNCSWCFLCATGGSLVCCDACPASFHETCLGYAVSQTDAFLCGECEGGRMPMHGDIVWAKMAHYRWWPSLVVHPDEVPRNVCAVEHSPGQFPIRFFGTGEYFWIDRLRVFMYATGDFDVASRGKSKGKSHPLDQKFLEGLRQAEEAYEARRKHVDVMKQVAEVGNGGRKCRPPPYTKIRVNKPVGRVKQVDFNLSEAQICDCDPNGDDPCGVNSECLNRNLNIECHPSLCRAGPRCGNQLFQRRTYPRVVPFPIPGKGWGLKAAEDIKEGTFVIEYVGELIDDEEYESRVARKHTSKDQHYYFLTLDQNRIIDAGPKGNLARFMNHSCEPNCVTQKWEVAGDARVGLFALKDIKEGEELTFNYNLESFCKTQKKVCECKAASCSGYIGDKAKDPTAMASENAVAVQPKNARKLAGKRKARGGKRGKRTSKVAVAGVREELTVHDAQCYYCGKVADDPSLMIRCSECPRSFHRECLDRDEFPWEVEEGLGRLMECWRCPRHFCCRIRCVEDSNREKYCCDHCPTAFCDEHGPEGGIIWLGKLGYICPRHAKKSVEALVNHLTPEYVFGVPAKRPREPSPGGEN